MLGSIAIKEEIYACEMAQICVGLHVGEFISLSESSNTSNNIFYSVKYFFLVHDYVTCIAYLLQYFDVWCKVNIFKDSCAF